MTATTPYLKILHVVDSLERGGLERVMTDLAMMQVSRGHEVTVFSINATVGLLPTLEAAGIPVVVGGKARSFDLTVLRKLRSTVAKRKISIVHAHNFVPNYYAAAALVGTSPRPPLVGTCHDMGDRLANRKLRWMYRLSLMRTRRLAMCGQHVHDQYLASGLVRADMAETALNGIPVGRFSGSAERRQAARRELGLADDIPVIGCVGRLVEFKNHALMIASMPALLRSHPTLRLVVLGEGPLRSALQAQAAALNVSEHVDLPGVRPNVADLLPAFDIFAMPSRTEGVPIALIEACATGLAAVATDAGGNSEIIQDGQTGLVVPVDDGEALCAALESLLRDPALRAQMGAAARQWVGENASIDALFNTYDRFYRRAM